jgi:very-short-patch-repair endonuclease/ribosomal protein S14
MKKTCSICNEVFNSHSVYANHVRWKHTDQSSYKEKLSTVLQKRSDDRFGSTKREVRRCEKCGKDFEIIYRKRIPTNRFCSRSCANSGRVRSQDVLTDLSHKMKIKWQDETYRQVMNIVREGTSFAFRSKGEKDLLAELNLKFNNAFSYGGNFKLADNVYLSLDCFSHSLKVCVEYDGIWHFKDIKGQLSHKQNKDVLLKQFCSKNGYQLIRVKDERYFKEKEFILNSIESHIKAKDLDYIEFY